MSLSCGTIASSSFASPGATWRCVTSRRALGDRLGDPAAVPHDGRVHVSCSGSSRTSRQTASPTPATYLPALLPMDVLRVVRGAVGVSVVANLSMVTKVYFPRVLLPLARVSFRSSTSVRVRRTRRSCGCFEVVAGRAKCSRPAIRCAGARHCARRRLASFGCRRAVPRRSVPPSAVDRDPAARVCGAVFAINEIPEKWQWLLSVNPMTARDHRVALGPHRCAHAELGKMALSVVVAIAIFVVGLAILPSSEPRFADTI